MTNSSVQWLGPKGWVAWSAFPQTPQRSAAMFVCFKRDLSLAAKTLMNAQYPVSICIPWLAGSTNKRRADWPQEFLSIQKVILEFASYKQLSKGGTDIVGDMGVAHRFLQLHLGPLTSVWSFIQLYMNCHYVSILPLSSQSCSPISIPVTCPNPGFPICPRTCRLSSSNPSSPPPQNDPLVNQVSAAVSLSLISHSIKFRKPDALPKMFLCRR